MPSGGPHLDPLGERDPHAGRLATWRGPPVTGARLAAVLVHGRGGSARDMLGLARQLDAPDVTYVAPEAADRTWYPRSFMAPLADNEPGLSSALGVLSGLVAEIGRHGLPAHRVVLLGFSQGACLALELAARQARRYAAVVGLSGGLIGPPGASRDDAGSMDGTPVFLGCSDVDAHVPVERVRETAAVFRGLGAEVDERIYPGMGHTVNDDELETVRALLRR